MEAHSLFELNEYLRRVVALNFQDALWVRCEIAQLDISREHYYLSLVEWTGQRIRSDKPGSLPVNLKPVLDRFGLDAVEWADNVASYGSLFHRIAGKVEQLLSYARGRGQSWFCGRSGSASRNCTTWSAASVKPAAWR